MSIIESSKNAARITGESIQGPPSFLVEIRSRSTQGCHRSSKRALYERSQAPERRVVGPDKERIERHARKGSGSRVLRAAHAEEVLGETLPGVLVDLRRGR